MLWVLIRSASPEVPRQGASNEYPQHIFFREIRKILCGYPLLSAAMYEDILEVYRSRYIP